VQLAPGDHGVVEHINYRATQRLGPVDHRQDGLGDIKAAFA
jgi:hypothetical protein